MAAAVDVSLLEYLSDGTNQGLTRQIDLFLAALAEAETQMEQAATGVNFPQLAEAAHGVLSHARLVGCSTLATATSALEHAARSSQPAALGELRLRVHREIQALTAVVRRHPGAERPV